MIYYIHLLIDGFCSGDLDERAPVQPSQIGFPPNQRASTVNVNESALKKSPNMKSHGKVRLSLF